MENEEYILKILEDIVKIKLQNEGTGHDWEHVYRVSNYAKIIAQKEKNVNMFILKICALLHDVADHKFIPKESERKKIIANILFEVNIPSEYINDIIQIIESISFQNGQNPIKCDRIESKIIQDADRLDSLGAIGIARAFAYGGSKGSPIFLPQVSTEGLRQDTIEHFYSKLLKLSFNMNTQTGKEMAVKRHQFLELYLKEFYIEWFGEKEGLIYFKKRLEKIKE